MNKKIKIAWCCIATFFSLCLVVIVINVFNMKEGVLENIDALTHFFGGTFVAIIILVAFLPAISRPVNKIIFTVAFLAFCGFGWEAVEIWAWEAGCSAGTLFEETNRNRTSDLLFGLLGFVSFPLIVKMKTRDIKKIFGAGKHKFF